MCNCKPTFIKVKLEQHSTLFIDKRHVISYSFSFTEEGSNLVDLIKREKVYSIHLTLSNDRNYKLFGESLTNFLIDNKDTILEMLND